MEETKRSELDAVKEVIYWDKRDEIGFLKAFWLTWKEVVLHPKSFFSKMGNISGLGNPLLFGIIVFSLCSLIGLGYLWIIPLAGINLYPEIGLSRVLRIYFWIVLLTPFGASFIIFIKSAFFHSILWLLRARKGFQATFRVVAYSTGSNLFYLFCVPMGLFAATIMKNSLPSAIRIIFGYSFWVLMVLGMILTVIWPLVLHIIGFKYAHNISFFRSICSVIIYYVLIAIIVTVSMFGFRCLMGFPRPIRGLTSKSEGVEEESKFIGQEFPQFALDDLYFREVKLDDFQSKVVVVAFWPDYFTPSKNEIVILNSLSDKYKSEKVLISAISVRKDFGRVKKLSKETKIVFQILMDWGELSEQFWGVISSHYTPTRPIIFILDKSGVIQYAYHTQRVVPSEKILSKNIDGLLSEVIPKSPIKKGQRVQIESSKETEKAINEYEASLYFKSNLIDYNINHYSPEGINLVDDLGKNIIKEPQRQFEKRVYGILPFGKSKDNVFKCILDFNEPPQKRQLLRREASFITQDYILYFDKNNNNDLTEEGEKIKEAEKATRVDNIKIRYNDGAESPYYIRVYFYFNDWEKSYYMSYYRDCAMEGQIKLGDKTYKIALLDENSDGFYTILDDDMLFDFNDDGKLDGKLVPRENSEYYKVAEGFDLKDSFSVNGKSYKVTYVSEKGDRIRIRQISQ